MQPITKIDADYLSQALGSLVESFQIEPIGSGEGYMSNLYRITLQGAALPDSIILKLPSTDTEKIFTRRPVQFLRSGATFL